MTMDELRELIMLLSRRIDNLHKICELLEQRIELLENEKDDLK